MVPDFSANCTGPHYRESFPANNKKSMQMRKFSTANDLHYTVFHSSKANFYHITIQEVSNNAFTHFCSEWNGLQQFVRLNIAHQIVVSVMDAGGHLGQIPPN